jgi:putative acyl-CoA dehydrogenase
MSAPMCDAFLVLAQAPDGLSCFLLPRFRPNGSVNALHFQRLKDKLGNRSNASTEVEFVDAFALRVGEEGKGIRTILKMVQLTRLDCVISSAGMMRAALARAVFHCRYRGVFGKHLVGQPMMRAVLADLVLESEGALALTMRLCRAFDHSKVSSSEAAWARLMTPAAKYWICKTAPNFVYEAMECLGGNGYVEENTLARLFREAPVNAIWEGSGNVMCLDVLRVSKHHSDEVRGVLAELAHEAPDLPGASVMVSTVERMLQTGAEADARTTVESLARLAAAASLKASAPEIVAAAFARTRLSDVRGGMWGTAALADGEHELLLQRALRTSELRPTYRRD